MQHLSQHLVESARNDPESFAVLIRQWERCALSIAYAVLGDADEAGDVAQLAFVRVWQRLHTLRQPERFGSWFCGIVRNLARDAKRRRRPVEALDGDETQCRNRALVHDPCELALREERSQWIADALSTLSEANRAVLVLKYYDDCSSKEIAERLGASVEAVDMRLCRARRELRTALSNIRDPDRLGADLDGGLSLLSVSVRW